MSLNAKVLLESRCRWLYQYFIIHIHTHTYIYIYIHKYMVNCAIKFFFILGNTSSGSSYNWFSNLFWLWKCLRLDSSSDLVLHETTRVDK